MLPGDAWGFAKARGSDRVHTIICSAPMLAVLSNNATYIGQVTPGVPMERMHRIKSRLMAEGLVEIAGAVLVTAKESCLHE